MLGVVEVQRVITDVLNEIVELGVALVGAAELHNAVAHVIGKLVAERAPRNANNRKLLRQQIGLVEVEQRRKQLALGQIARRSEDHHDRRFRNPLLPLLYMGKIVRTYSHLHRRHLYLSSSITLLQDLNR